MMQKPLSPCFSSGPTKKHDGWHTDAFKEVIIGRSHRSDIAQERIKLLIKKHRELLSIPDDYHVLLTPGSCTGAVNMAMASITKDYAMDCLVWDDFGGRWAKDAEKMGFETRILAAETPGEMINLGDVDFTHDVIFTWCGTSTGVQVPNGDWIDDNRLGLIIADVTSAAFITPLPWQKIDIAAWSFQKALGGEAGIGMLALSPRAKARMHHKAITSLRLPKNNNFCNTPSLLVIEDMLLAFRWVEKLGGANAIYQKVENNRRVINEWLKNHDKIRFLVENSEYRSPAVHTLWVDGDHEKIVKILAEKQVAYDIHNHRHAPPGLRVWGGPTISAGDLMLLSQWIDDLLQIG